MSGAPTAAQAKNAARAYKDINLLAFKLLAPGGLLATFSCSGGVSAELFQALNDTGFTIPAAGVTYWVGEAMQGEDYLDRDPTPEKTAETTKTVAANAAHLAALLKPANYPS